MICLWKERKLPNCACDDCQREQQYVEKWRNWQVGNWIQEIIKEKRA